jgi:streptogramin lyase
MTGSSKWAPSTAGFVDEDIAAGADGRLRLLRTNTDGHSEISTIDASGQRAAAQVFVNASFHGRRISAGAEGRTRLLWNTPEGTAQVWLLNPDNTENSRYDMPALP